MVGVAIEDAGFLVVATARLARIKGGVLALWLLEALGIALLLRSGDGVVVGPTSIVTRGAVTLPRRTHNIEWGRDCIGFLWGWGELEEYFFHSRPHTGSSCDLTDAPILCLGLAKGKLSELSW